MNFSDYQTRSRLTAQYPSLGHPVIYPGESQPEVEARLRSIPGVSDVLLAKAGGAARLVV